MKKGILLAMAMFLVCFSLYLFHVQEKKNTLEIHIGYQSVTSQTWGALIVKEKKLLEEKLKVLYPDKKIKIVWHDEMSGAIINTNMISGKVQFGFMGDMPLILNSYKAETIKGYNSRIIAFDGKGSGGINQSILVSIDSKIDDITDLKGKTITTPIGSSAHFMLMKILEKNNLLETVDIVHQDVALASQLLSAEKTDAFAIWAPYPNFLEDKKIGKVLVDGSESEIDYLAGVVVDYDWAKENEEIVNAFLEALDEAHKFIIKYPNKASKIFSRQSGFDLEITKKETNNIDWDISITEDDVRTMLEKEKFLVSINQIEKFDLEKYMIVEEGV